MVLYQLKIILHNFIRKNMNHEQHIRVQEDEIDLHELWTILVKRKVTIFIVIVISSLIATTFAWTTVPIYNGSILLEVGEVVNNQVINNQPTTIYSFDNINNLKEITTQATGTDATIPNGTSNVLKLSIESSNPSEIKTKLENAAQFIIARHQEKAKLYRNDNSKIRMTQVIGDIQIESDSIKPKKQLIVGVGIISGLILGIFLAFFLEFIGTRRNR